MRCFMASRSPMLFRCLQSIQNAAARLLTGARRHNHISSVLRRLYWLSVKQRVIYKLAVHKSLHGQAPSYHDRRYLPTVVFVPGGRRLPADCSVRTPPASLCGHQRTRCPANIHSTRRQEFPGCRTENMEQFARVIATA